MYRTYHSNLQGIEDLLNGCLILGPFDSKPGLPLGAKTLIFSTPAATVTFSGSAGALLTPEQIQDEIENTVGLSGYSRYRGEQSGPRYSQSPLGVIHRQLIIIQKDTGFTIDKDGTANPILGLSTTADIVSAGVIAAAKIAGFSQGSTPAHYAIIIAP